VALSLDRDWFSPDQAKRLVDVAASEGLIERDGDELVVGFAADEMQIPEDFVPKEDVLKERSTFESALDAVVETGIEKQEAVAGDQPAPEHARCDAGGRGGRLRLATWHRRHRVRGTREG